MADESLQLARTLASQHADVAEYQVEVPRALNDLARVQLNASEFNQAAQSARDARNLLDAIADQKEQAKEENSPPEWRGARKNSLLIEARALVENDAQTLEPATRMKVRELLDQAGKLGASAEELRKILE